MNHNQYDSVKNYALRLLSIRPRSEKELEHRISDYIRKKNLSVSIAPRLISFLKQLDYLNDSEFSRWWILQRRTVSIKGLKIIKYELKQKGVSDDIISDLLNEEKESEHSKAQKLLDKYLKKNKSVSLSKYFIQKIKNYLTIRGFSYDVINGAIDEIIQK